MRHKYETRGIVLSRTSIGEANTLVALITQEIGLVRARAQGVRKSGAKLASALVTCAESEVTLVRGKEGWRIAGAVLKENWFYRLENSVSRARAARLSGLLLRMVAGEARDHVLFPIMNGFFEALATLPEDTHESVEALAALRILSALGLDGGGVDGTGSEFSPVLLAEIAKDRTHYITRINRGIAASGL